MVAARKTGQLLATASPRNGMTTTLASLPEQPADIALHDSVARTPPPATPPIPPAHLPLRSLLALIAQHLSSSWGSRSFEFASYLFLVTLFPDTLLPASIYGFITTGFAILLSGSVGQIVDTTPRLKFVRACIVLQKVTVSSAYAIFLVFFLKLEDDAHEHRQPALVWSLFALIVLAGSVLTLATIGINISIERDWATTICEGNSASLTQINAYLRRVDLVCKLVAPLFVSLLTTAVSYPFAAAFLLGFAVCTMAFEFIWINIVWRFFPILSAEEADRTRLIGERRAESREAFRKASLPDRGVELLRRTRTNLQELGRDWKEFVKSPIFPSSLSVSLLYLTVLSFDGTMITYLKSKAFSDAFIAGMRGICVVTGLLGTFLMPVLESHLGLVRAGSWSIISEVLSLIPVLLSFFVGATGTGSKGPRWNSAMLFTGMALSRIGLWAFDMCQLKEIQLALDKHSRKNSIMALQYTLQNILSLATFIVTIIFRNPDEFKWPAVISFVAVSGGAVAYLYYVRQERGHLVHWELLRKRN